MKLCDTHFVQASCAGNMMNETHEAFKKVLTECWDDWDREAGLIPCQGQLDSIIYDFVENNIVNNADIAERCGNVQIAYTLLDPEDSTMNNKSVYVQKEYKSGNDVLEALISTSFLSCESACVPYFVNKGRPVSC